MPLRLSWQEIHQITVVLSKKIQADNNPDLIVTILRGGVIPGVMLSHHLGVRDLLTLDIRRTLTDDVCSSKQPPTIGLHTSLDSVTNRHVLLVDDVVGTGDTITAALNLLTAAKPLTVRSAVCVVNLANWYQHHHRKPCTSISYVGQSVQDWVIFPWEGV